MEPARCQMNQDPACFHSGSVLEQFNGFDAEELTQKKGTNPWFVSVWHLKAITETYTYLERDHFAREHHSTKEQVFTQNKNMLVDREPWKTHRFRSHFG